MTDPWIPELGPYIDTWGVLEPGRTELRSSAAELPQLETGPLIDPLG